MAGRVSTRTRSVFSGAAVGIVVGVIAAVLAIARPGFLEGTEAATYDRRVRAVKDPALASKDIVLIDIAEADIENAENGFDLTFPWPRSVYGTIAAYCKRAGAKVLLFDWLFQDRGRGDIADDEDFAKTIHETGNVVLGLALNTYPRVERALEGPFAAKLGVYPTAAAADELALKLSAWNVRAFVFPRSGGFELWYGGKKSEADVTKIFERLSGPEALPKLFERASDAEDAPALPPEIRQLGAAELGQEFSVTSLIRERDGYPFTGDFPRREGLDPPLAVIGAAPARLGNVFQAVEGDGIMRRHAPFVQHGNVAYPAIWLASYLVAHPTEKPALEGDTLVVGPHRIRLDGEGKVTLRYYGRNLYQHYSSYEVLRSSVMIEEGAPPAVPFSALKDKYVILSATGIGLRDLRSTPIATTQLGAEVNAIALDNLINDAFIHRAPRAVDGAVSFVICVSISLLMILVWRKIRQARLALPVMAVITTSILVGYYLLARTLLGSSGLWIAVAVPSIGGVVSAFATLLALSAVERSGKRFVQEALGRYTSTALVRELMEHPEYLSLEWGESRQMSVYFSDIAGFTSISEGLKPEDLVALLNDYLTTMTDLVLAHGGVVDKYIGDAIMAFWGAPIAEPDHARKATLCAIAMRKKCDELRARWHQRYGHEVFARAGVNSGAAVVGNMGSKHKYNYTVMGDMVNLASRLEGANKAYGTFLMVSESTVEKLGGSFDVRELDRIAVKGKDKAVTVFEVLDETGKTCPEWLACARRFEDGLAKFRGRQFEAAIAIFEEVLAKRDDGPSRTYIERSREFIAEPPPADWDGVWRMKEKL